MDSHAKINEPGPLFREIDGSAHEAETETTTLSAPRVRKNPNRSRRSRKTADAPHMTIPESPIPAVNVAQVPQRSPLRYPGGKTWLIPHIRAWLGDLPSSDLLIEPFAGGGVVSLTAVMEGLVKRCILVELDRDVAAFWHAALRHGDELIHRVQAFDPTRSNVQALANATPQNAAEHGFRTLVLNRTRRGGILAPGASLSKKGENGQGVSSRWYPGTLVKRLEAIRRYAERIAFCETDGMQFLEALACNLNKDVVVFVDPPYTAGGKRAGSRLYAHSEIDHERLFAILAETGANFLMTYDCAPEIMSLIRLHGFSAVRVLMKNSHHTRLPELIITPRPVFHNRMPRSRRAMGSLSGTGIPCWMYRPPKGVVSPDRR